MLTADCAVAVLIVIGCNLYFGPPIDRDKIAMQWGFDGSPTWHAPKWLALWGTIAFMVAIRLLIWAAMTYFPQYVHGVEIGVLGFSVGMVVIQVYVLNEAAKAN